MPFLKLLVQHLFVVDQGKNDHRFVYLYLTIVIMLYLYNQGNFTHEGMAVYCNMCNLYAFKLRAIKYISTLFLFIN